jgi:hypothetical protein
MRALVIAAILCASAAPSGAAPDKLEKKYPHPFLFGPSDAFKVPGLTLYWVTGPAEPDRNGPSFIVGVDADGNLVENRELFKRAVLGLSPADAARRAFDTLLGSAGGEALDPAKDKRPRLIRPDDWALVRAPAIDNGVLTFWMSDGDRRPSVLRLQIPLASGIVERRWPDEVRHPPEEKTQQIRAQLHAADVATIKKGLARVGERDELAPDVEPLLLHADKDVRRAALAFIIDRDLVTSCPAVIKLFQDAPTDDERTNAGLTLLQYWPTPESAAAVRAFVAKAGASNPISSLREALQQWDAKYPH